MSNYFRNWIQSALSEIVGGVSFIPAFDNNGTFSKISPANIIPDVSDFLTQDEIEALPGFGGNFSFNSALIQDIKPDGSNGGSSISGEQVRDLNTIVHNPSGIVSLTGNQITLVEGFYMVFAVSSAYCAYANWLTFWSVSNGKVIQGSSAFGAVAYSRGTTAVLVGGFPSGTAETFELRHVTTAGKPDNGLGVGISGFGPQVFSSVLLWRVSE